MYIKKKIEWWNENKTHHNACNSCRTSSTMKHEDFHLGIFPQSFAFKRFNYSTKLLHIWWLVMIHATSISMQCASNTINVNNWNFTSLVLKVASIQTTPLSCNETMDYNCDKVWIPIVNGTLISINFTHILKIKHIIWMIKYPCMHENGQVFV